MEQNLPHLIVIFVSLLLSVFFSASETAFFSLSKVQLLKIKKEFPDKYERVLRLLKNPRQLLILILLGNTIVNVTAASTAAIIAIFLSKNLLYRHAEAAFIMVEIILMTLLVLFWGEITPKLLAYRSPVKVAIFTSFLLEVLSYLLWPIIKLLDFIGSLVSKTNDVKYFTMITPDDFKHLILSKSADKSFKEKEKNMLDSIFNLSTTSAKDIMVPRVEIVAVNVKESLEYLKKVITESGFSRIPIYKINIDNIIGFVYAKDIILSQDKQTINTLLRPAYFIPPNVKIHTLLNQFKYKKLHIAVIVDEYGGTSGLITLEDILEELVGEINDEYDQDKPMIIKLKDDEFLLDGMCSISELNQLLFLSIDKNHYDNLADFLYDKFNKVPHKNESFILENIVKFTIVNAKAQRIQTVKAKKLSQDDEN